MKILRYKTGYISIALIKENTLQSIIKDIFSYGLALVLQIINYKYLGNGFFINSLFFFVFIAFLFKNTVKEISKKELLEIINKGK